MILYSDKNNTEATLEDIEKTVDKESRLEKNVFSSRFSSSEDIFNYFIRDELVSLNDNFRLIYSKIDKISKEYNEYLINLKGKNLRAGLLFLTSKSCGGLKPIHVNVATIIEIIHLATLIHDDVIDHGKVRRAKTSINVKWGNTFAVLLGDLLFTQAFTETINLNDNYINKAVTNVTKDLCQGEIIQNSKIGDFDITEEDYLKIINLKTASLFSLSTMLAAYCSNASEENINLFSNIGKNFGYAYQIYDDCLDMSKKDKIVGKTLGTDITNGKITLPITKLINKSDSSQKKVITELINNNDIESITLLEHWSSALSEAKQLGKKYINKSIKDLEIIESNSYIEQQEDIKDNTIKSSQGLRELCNHLAYLLDKLN